MTFNEGMRIDTSTTSSSGGGRGPGRGIAVGGGVGGLLIVVVALFLGIDPGTVLQQPQMSTEGVEAPGFDLSQCQTGEDANNIVQCRVVATGNSLDGVWSQLMPGYTRPRIELFTGGIDTGGCGFADSAVGPFYCPGDQTAYFDTSFFDTLVTQFGSSGGPLAEEYVVAHEFGHHIQNLEGTLARAQQDPEGPTGGGVRTELQADCYAGVWAHYAAITKQEGTDVTFLKPLTDKDIQDALSAASAVGDDRIQEAATGRVTPESWTHGSSEQRQKWFTTGYQTGEPAKCDTFATNNLG
ncbi:KPN_02809 family neutral zinc metallopeptidase [Mycolicibacterium pyrenivorans]|uniref:KPN_02809 family neutral zinc metallopeptidase n=1 Tax=Mycolicibacterium pyrenivorans TaxID=187102 RepID=UPI0021F33A25|nr:neutral zinc metallopeptidase [Mycolicibacterium pyrenivorans]MCV7152367.1 neutral zinc metallopeptidase [Mycolicibacterium pyrenivorans]